MPVKTTIKTFRPTYVAREWNGNGASEPSGGSDSFVQSAQATQVLNISEGHPHHRLGRTLADIGGSFDVVKRDYDNEKRYFVNQNRATPYATVDHSNYRGYYYAHDQWVGDSSFPTDVHASNLELEGYGTTAIARTIPTNPLSGLVQALVELRREGLPSIQGAQTWRDRAFTARSAGSEYLNHQFGWVPLLNDIQDFYNVVTNHEEIVREYERNSGKLIRRRYTFDPVITTSTTTQSNQLPSPALKTGYFWQGGTKRTVTSVKTETWFSGAFTYYLPPFDPNGDNRKRNEQIANKLFGTRPTPELLWNLVPWTWAADWVTNTGDFLRNVSAFQNDGLVMPWGYVMRKRTVTKDYTLDTPNVGITCTDCTPTAKVPPYNTGPLRQTFTTTVKQRVKATPYGFGLNPASFTSRQWAILAALGISRSGSKLG